MLNRAIPKFKNKQERIEYWHSIYKSSLTSKFTKVKFCVQHNISDASLYRWSKYFEKQQCINKQHGKPNLMTIVAKQPNKKSQDKHNTTFMPVTVTDVKAHTLAKLSNNHTAMPSEAGSSMELLMPNGIKLIFRQEAGMALLMQLITWRG